MLIIARRLFCLILGASMLAALGLAAYSTPNLDADETAMVNKARSIFRDAHNKVGIPYELHSPELSTFNSVSRLHERLHWMAEQNHGRTENIIHLEVADPVWDIGNRHVYYASRVRSDDKLAEEMGLKVANLQPHKDAFAIWKNTGTQAKLLAIDTHPFHPEVHYRLEKLANYIPYEQFRRLEFI
ncbi:uncharacterized protein UTRI_10430_B [Ustilago trichophora]|uniref:Uncharacterized protein n=1 Tax=Ustilago trichophora TaxID=86804 RepID=A0A5C3E8A2_9BASI|nr:uncharacterized protein UTRI_10430_B [Ustilago trichophora]